MKSCHFFPGCVKPVSLVNHATKPRPVMKGAVTYPHVHAFDLQKGCGLGAWNL